jgi:hypothetical protein
MLQLVQVISRLMKAIGSVQGMKSKKKVAESLGNSLERFLNKSSRVDLNYLPKD